MTETLLQRETLVTSVLMDHFSTRRLEAKSGYAEDDWPSMIVKELADNGIDAAESAGRPPEISIRVDVESIVVRDNGDGLPEATLQKSIDYSVRVSDKARVVNWSASIKEDPFQLTWTLYDQRCNEDSPVVLVVHVACPKVHWADEGKTTASLPDKVAKQLRAAVENVSATWKRKQVAKERAEAATMHRRERKKKEGEPKELVRDAIEEALPEAVRQATGNHSFEVSVRNLFYAVRALVLAVAASIKDLNFSYFRKVIKQYQAEHGKIELLYEDPQGYLLEPHTGKVVPLGTREVRGYQPPVLLYDKLIFVEKKGLQPLFVAYKIAEKYDAAIVCGEGYAADAAVDLLRRSGQHEMIIGILHDADPDGYAIARQLQAKLKSTNVKVVDLGLHLQEALDMELPLEPFLRDTLRTAFAELAPAGKQPGPRSIGMKLHHLRRRVVGGKFFDRREKRAITQWFVASASCGTTATTATKPIPTYARTHAHARTRETNRSSPTSGTSPTSRDAPSDAPLAVKAEESNGVGSDDRPQREPGCDDLGIGEGDAHVRPGDRPHPVGQVTEWLTFDGFTNLVCGVCGRDLPCRKAS